jgi:hypothetical protein
VAVLDETEHKPVALVPHGGLGACAREVRAQESEPVARGTPRRRRGQEAGAGPPPPRPSAGVGEEARERARRERVREEEPAAVHEYTPERAHAPAPGEGMRAEAAKDSHEDVSREGVDAGAAVRRVHGGQPMCFDGHVSTRRPRGGRAPPVTLGDVGHGRARCCMRMDALVRIGSTSSQGESSYPPSSLVRMGSSNRRIEAATWTPRFHGRTGDESMPTT